jgi:methylmalonyl-CoA/ethylmalonyl-CoA epimerase
MTTVQRVDHIAIAVSDLRPAVTLFQGVFGAEFMHGGDDPRIDIRTVQLRMPPGIKIELMTPTKPTSYLQAFIDKKGEGFHHMTIMVDDVEQTIDDLGGAHFQLVDTNLSHPKWRETFMRPSQGFGLLQIVDSDGDWMTPTTEYTLEDVLQGRIIWRDHSTGKKRHDDT